MAAAKSNIASLIEQMPETDRDLQAIQAAARPKEADAPAPGETTPRTERLGLASKFTGPAPDQAGKVFVTLLEGGPESLGELLSLVRDPGDPDYSSYKAAYVLHGLCLHVGKPGSGREAHRRRLAELLAAHLARADHSPAVKRTFLRELQVVGGPEVVPALGQHLLEEELSEGAIHALLAIHDGAAERFRASLGNATGEIRIALVQALGALQDTGAIVDFKKLLEETDPELRRIAAWALANSGSLEAVEAVLRFADAADGWERSGANGYCVLLAEKLAAAGKKGEAARIYTHLRETRTRSTERHLREQVEKALGALR